VVFTGFFHCPGKNTFNTFCGGKYPTLVIISIIVTLTTTTIIIIVIIIFIIIAQCWVQLLLIVFAAEADALSVVRYCTQCELRRFWRKRSRDRSLMRTRPAGLCLKLSVMVILVYTLLLAACAYI